MAHAIKAIRSGLPATDFDRVAAAMSLTMEELAGILGVSPRTVRDQRTKHLPLSRENSEKLVRVARIQKLARTIFSSDAAVAQWLAAPAPALDGQRPFDLLDTELGAREVESVLQGIAYGNVM